MRPLPAPSRASRLVLLAAFACAAAFAARPADAQSPAPLRKSDIVQLLTGTTYSSSEVARIVRRSCLAFTPTARDRQDLVALGATPQVLAEIDRCAARANRTTPARRGAPARRAEPLTFQIAQPHLSAGVGTVALLPVLVQRGSRPAPGVRLLLRGTANVPGSSPTELSAVTDARGVATFAVPAGTAVGSYPLTVLVAGDPLAKGAGAVTLATTPAAAEQASVSPAVLAIAPGQRDTVSVVATVHDGFGNPVANAPVELRPQMQHGAVPAVSRATGDRGQVRFSVPTAALRDGDGFDLVVHGRIIGSVQVSTAGAAVAANMAAGRTAGLMLDAARLAAAGQHAAAERVYDSVLAVDRNILAARLGRAYVRSWQREDSAARHDFRAVLQADPKNIAALTGLAYNHAWAGDYAQASTRFQQALAIAPDDIDAEKGLAYVSLWSGNAPDAARRFAALSRAHPRDAEAAVGLGQAELRMKNAGAARQAFHQALRLDPTRTDARQGLTVASGPHRTSVELTAWGGYSSVTANGPAATTTARNASGTGLRFAELAFWPTSSVRIWAQYDDGLSLDNLAILQSGQKTPAYYVGGYTVEGARQITRLEVGTRTLPGNVHQTLFRGEQDLAVGSASTLKLGGWLGAGSGHSEWIGYGAFRFPVSSRVQLEPTFFYSRGAVPGSHETRGLLYGEYRFTGGATVGVGAAAGSITPGSAAAPATPPLASAGTGSVLVPATGPHGLWDVYLLANAPVGSEHLQLLLRHQRISGGPGLTVVGVGLTLGF